MSGAVTLRTQQFEKVTVWLHMGVTENKNQAFYLLISSVFPAQCLAQTKYICVC